LGDRVGAPGHPHDAVASLSDDCRQHAERSTAGCWQVVGKVGRAKLTFVVKVSKVKKISA
jgi:hypothetical protein